MTPDFTDPNLTAGVSSTYALNAYDYHWNGSSVQITVMTPPTGNIDPRKVGVRSLGSYLGDGSEQIDYAQRTSELFDSTDQADGARVERWPVPGKGGPRGGENSNYLAWYLLHSVGLNF